MGSISFTNHQISFSLKQKLFLKTFLPTIFSEEGVEFKSLSYIFCNDDFLLSLNLRYLNHNTLTDILTFTLSETSLPIISEVYISIDRVTENAHLLGLPFNNELYRVMIHGILHLCGYSDHTPEQKNTMRAKEDFYLAKMNCST